MTTYKYDEKLVTKLLQCEVVYEEYALNEIFGEGLDVVIPHSMRECRV